MPSPRTIDDVTCLGCGCLCDDITLTVSEDGGVLHPVNLDCDLGRRWFETVQESRTPPDIPRVARQLASARNPLITGLASASIQAQRLAVELADRTGATIDAGTLESRARLAAMARVGRCSASLGEVRDRADVVLFWFCDPITTHPRHLERYSANPNGRFVPDGRHLIVVDDTANATSARADETLLLDREHRIAALATLRALLHERPVDTDRLLATTGHGIDTWSYIVKCLRGARYGVIFTGDSLSDPAEYETLLLLVRELNQRPDGRFVHLTLGAAGDVAGAEAVLGWQTGYAPDVCFAAGHPERLDTPPDPRRHDVILDLSALAPSRTQPPVNETMRSDGVILHAPLGLADTQTLQALLAHLDTDVRSAP